MNLQIEPQTFKAIKSDMAEIAERLGRDKVLFVTHVNATTPDEEVIPTRDRLILGTVDRNAHWSRYGTSASCNASSWKVARRISRSGVRWSIG